jgi:hypothetical protein
MGETGEISMSTRAMNDVAWEVEDLCEKIQPTLHTAALCLLLGVFSGGCKGPPCGLLRNRGVLELVPK